MGYIFKYLKRYPAELSAVMIATVVTCAAILGMPTMLAKLIDNAILVNQMDRAWPYVWGMVLCTVLGFIARSVRMYMASKVVNDMTMAMRNDVYHKMMALSHHEFQEFGVPSLTNRITNDAFVLLQFVEMILKQGLMGPVMILFSVIKIIRMQPNLGLRMIPAVLVIITFVVLISIFSKPLSEKQQLYLDKINRILRESITGLRVIRAFNREDFQNDRFMAVNEEYRRTASKLFKLMASAPTLFYLTTNLALVFIIWIGAHLIEAGSLQVGTLSAFIEYMFEGLFSLVVFAWVFMMYPRASVSANRLKSVLEAPITVRELSDDEIVDPGQIKERGTLEFINVDFAYPDADEPVLRNISFKSKPGQTVAFIGSTGSGKSTIVKLIPRFYDVTRGKILVDGVDIRHYRLADLRSKIGFTPQSALLFKGNIADNLRYGKHDADETDMEHATQISQAQEFVEKLDQGYQAELTEKASNLSGGQKQRLSIARSIIKDREIYIFDDSFSALDYKTDAQVRAALKQETKDATTIIVAQRVGTIMHADQIIVLNQGRIDAIGTHKELLKKSKIYYNIASSQLSEEELTHG